MYRTLAPAIALVGLTVAALVGPVNARQAEVDEEASYPTVLFDSHDIIDLTLTTDIHSLTRDRDSLDREEHPGILTYRSSDGNDVALNVKVRTRGHFRRLRRTCNFPPIRLNFKKGEVGGTPFSNQDKIKLVTHCQNGRDDYEQNVLEEYLIYRTLGLLTDNTYQVRLARITYVDSTGRDDTLTKYGFLIEDDEDMAARLGGVAIEELGMHPRETDWDHMCLIDVFQYMIGNTDWSVVGPHNIIMVQTPTDYVAVPYDFDWSGAVNARYAKPDERLRIRRVRDRLFRGLCRPQEEFAPILDLFNQKKDEIYQLYEGLDGLSEDALEDALKYYDDFYKTISEPRSVKRAFIDNCREG